MTWLNEHGSAVQAGTALVSLLLAFALGGLAFATYGLETQRDSIHLAVTDVSLSSSGPDTWFVGVINKGFRATSIEEVSIEVLVNGQVMRAEAPSIDLGSPDVRGHTLDGGSWNYVQVHAPYRTATDSGWKSLVGKATALVVTITPAIGDAASCHLDSFNTTAALQGANVRCPAHPWVIKPTGNTP